MQGVKQVFILVLLLSTYIYCQVSPQWLQSNRIDTGNKVLVANHQSTTTTFSWNTSYNLNKTFSQNPTVILSIRQLMIASNSGQISFLSRITGMSGATLFYHFASMAAPTQIWYLLVRYLAYDGGYFSGAEISMMFKEYDNTDPDFTNIRTGAGTVRSDILDTGIAAVSTNRNILASFTTGFTGTITSTYFEGNITEFADAGSGNFKINITVHPDTQITKIAFYFLRIDLDQIFVKAQVFAQHAITKAYRGLQYTYYTPSKVLYQTNYISGLRSFSLVENVQYNFTISGLTFSTFNDSRYNDVTHVNLWLRYCPSPYIFFNKVDLMCYQLCPAGTYPVISTTVCQACDPQCATCSTSGSCLTCNNNRLLVGGTCVCQDYYYEYNGVCVQCHYSCQKCQYSGQYFNCDLCDPLMYRNPPTPGATNTTCGCDTGFVDVGVTMCDQICGDGIITVDACDDKNKDSNDGCSSNCQIQMYFECDPPAPPGTPKSLCYFIGDITIDVVRIQKDPNSNNATFYLKVQPFVQAFSQLKKQNLWTNISTAQFTSFSVKDGLLVLNITYYADFDGQTVMMGLKPTASSATNIFSRFFPKNDTFVAKADNGLYLNAYLKNDYTESKMYSQASLALGWIFLIFGLIFCFGDWKQIGLEMFFSLQICFMTFVVIPYHNPYITNSLNVKHVMGWNQLAGEVLPPYHKVPVLEHMGYSVAYQRNFNVMALFPCVALALYAVYRGMLYRHTKRRLEGDTSKQFEETSAGKILCYFKFDLFVYWMLVSMQQILMSTVIQTTYISNGAIFIFIILCLIGVIISIVALFWRPKSMQVYRKKLFHKTYGGKTFLIVLVSILVMDILILLSTLVTVYIFYATLICPVIVGIYVIARRPFKLLWNNFRLLIIQLCIITVISLQLGTLNIPYLQHKVLNIGILTCMAIILIVTLISWIYDIVKKICKLRDPQKYQQSSKYQSRKEEQSINEKVREAGYALVHGNGNASRLPTVYEMSSMPTKSQLKRSIVQPLKSPKQELVKKSTRKPESSRLRDDSQIKPKLRQASQLKSKSKQRQPELDQPKSSKIKASDYEQLRKDTQQKTDRPSARRPKVNPYTQILNQTAYRYK